MVLRNFLDAGICYICQWVKINQFVYKEHSLTDEEVERIVDFVKNQQEVEYDEAMMPSENTSSAGGSEPEDELFYEVIELLKEQETISTSYLQRRFRIGFNRAARMIDDLEARGYVGPADGSKGRKVNVHVFNENDASEPGETNA